MSDDCPDCGDPIEIAPGAYQANRCEKHRREAYTLVPKGVLEGLDDAVEGRTADGDDLDEALSWMGEEDE